MNFTQIQKINTTSYLYSYKIYIFAKINLTKASPEKKQKASKYKNVFKKLLGIIKHKKQEVDQEMYQNAEDTEDFTV